MRGMTKRRYVGIFRGVALASIHVADLDVDAVAIAVAHARVRYLAGAAAGIARPERSWQRRDAFREDGRVERGGDKSATVHDEHPRLLHDVVNDVGIAMLWQRVRDGMDINVVIPLREDADLHRLLPLLSGLHHGQLPARHHRQLVA